MIYCHLTKTYFLAVPDEDYQAVTQELVFGPSSTATCIYIQVFDDDTLESAENFTVSLISAAGDSTFVNFSLKEANVQILEDPTDGEEVFNLISVIANKQYSPLIDTYEATNEYTKYSQVFLLIWHLPSRAK